jgi:malate dehydrogenase (oxaloacetate-decarboxylating)(NADP+)
VDNELFFAAARALADQVTDIDLEQGRIFPPVTRIRDVALAVAAAVATAAYDRGPATRPRPTDVAAAAGRAMYIPRYL